MKNLFFPVLLILCLSANSQFSKLYDFQIEQPGSIPLGDLITDGIYFYGMTSTGGSSDYGTIFKVKPDGTEFTKLLDFTGLNGQMPNGSLLLYNNALYGMTYYGGIGSRGVIFKINTDGTGYSKLKEFDEALSNDGLNPNGSLVVCSNVLYGLTEGGGTSGDGTAFKINPDGTGFAKIFDFNGWSYGRLPKGSLTVSGNSLFGYTCEGGTWGAGTIFKIKTNGTGYTRVLDIYHSGADIANSQGGKPQGSLVLSGKTLYGMTSMGGLYNKGTLIKIDTNGTGFVKLLNFDSPGTLRSPSGSLVISGNVLYGMAPYSSFGNGGIFKINTDGTSYSNLFSFDVSSKGTSPFGSPLLIGNMLYGFTVRGGLNDKGTIHKINIDGTGFMKLVDFNAGNHPGPALIASSDSTLMGTSCGEFYRGIIFKINKKTNQFTRILEFNGTSRGALPKGAFIQSGNVIYGTTSIGGSNDKGIVYKVNTDGNAFQTLVDFNELNGANPVCALVLSGNVLYGLTPSGGINSVGVLFKVNTDGSAFNKLIEFDEISKGSSPQGSLILSGDYLYGTTSVGGTNNKGLIFKVKTDGTGFTKLIEFDGTTKGSTPYGNLIMQGNVLYGTTTSGGTNNLGVLYKLNNDGSGFTKLIDYDGANKGSAPFDAPVLLYDSLLYGLTSAGGTNDLGVFYKVRTDGSNYTKLVNFDGTTNGSNPKNTPCVSGSELFAVTPYGGTNGMGTIFRYKLPRPTTQASKLSVENIMYSQADIHWTNGGGEQRVVFVKQGTATFNGIKDSTSYTANAKIGSGTQLGTSGWYCVYNGTDTGFTVKGLIVGITYTVVVIEYIGTAGVEKYLTKTSTENTSSFTTPIFNQSICIIRYDLQEKKNMIVWEREKGMYIKSYKILKEKSTNIYDTLGTVPFDATYTYFIDSVTNPDIQAIKYKICLVDSLNRRSIASPYHRSVNLSKITMPETNQSILIWNEYEDESKTFVPSNYHIYRDSAKGTLSLFTDQPAGSPYYSVNIDNVLPGERFQIVVDRDPACNPSLPYKANSGPYAQSLSNIVEFKSSSFHTVRKTTASVYPNPFSNSLTVGFNLENADDVTIDIMNTFGQKLSSQKFDGISGQNIFVMNTEILNLTSGIYFLEITSGSDRFFLKCNHQ